MDLSPIGGGIDTLGKGFSWLGNAANWLSGGSAKLTHLDTTGMLAVIIVIMAGIVIFSSTKMILDRRREG